MSDIEAQLLASEPAGDLRLPLAVATERDLVRVNAQIAREYRPQQPSGDDVISSSQVGTESFGPPAFVAAHDLLEPPQRRTMERKRCRPDVDPIVVHVFASWTREAAGLSLSI